MMKALNALKRRANHAALVALANVHSRELTTKHSRASKLSVLLVLMLMSSAALASDEFSGFRGAIEEFAHGNFAIGISILAIILGALIGLAKTSVMPAMFGFGLAAVFSIGPYLVVKIFDTFKNLN